MHPFFLALQLTVVQAVILPSFLSKDASSWMSILPKANNVGQAVVCPGGSECPEFSICCMLTSGQWGCCPFPEATCCEDRFHCCPKNTHCDLAQQRCAGASNDEFSSPMLPKFLAMKPGKNAANVPCPDQQSECPDATTCCQMPNGEWGCCPFETAVCCSDKLHCCPQDTVCDIVKQRCSKQAEHDLFLTRFPPAKSRGSRKNYALKLQNSNMTDNICPDQHKCAEATTCCALKSGKYGCCPFAKADCCTDGLHCCPEGYKCDVKGGKCSKQ